MEKKYKESTVRAEAEWSQTPKRVGTNNTSRMDTQVSRKTTREWAKTHRGHKHIEWAQSHRGCRKTEWAQTQRVHINKRVRTSRVGRDTDERQREVEVTQASRVNTNNTRKQGRHKQS